MTEELSVDKLDRGQIDVISTLDLAKGEHEIQKPTKVALSHNLRQI